MIDFSSYAELVVADELPDDLDGTSEIDLLAACEAVRLWCGWHIAPVKTDDVVTVDQLGNQVLTVPSLHVTDVTAVIDADGRPITDYEWSAIGQLSRDLGWPRGFRAVTVTMTHGLTVTPAGVKSVVIDMLRERQKATAENLRPTGVKLDGAEVDFGQSSRGVRDDIGYSYGHILGRYRL